MSLSDCFVIVEASQRIVYCCKDENLIYEQGHIQSRYPADPSCLEMFSEESDPTILLGGLFTFVFILLSAIILCIYRNRALLLRLYTAVNEHLARHPAPALPAPIPIISIHTFGCVRVDMDVYPDALNPFCTTLNSKLQTLEVSTHSPTPEDSDYETTLRGVLSLPEDSASLSQNDGVNTSAANQENPDLMDLRSL